MDTLTHGIIGALAARSCTQADVKKIYLVITAVAAAFPDIDYLLFWFDPYKFITEWHRGVTHSLILFPIWATIISVTFYLGLHKRIPYRILFAYCSLGLLTHIATDLITLYGVQLFAPFTNTRYAFFIVFDLDPWIGLLAALGILFGVIKRQYAFFGLLGIVAYVFLSFNFQQQAQQILESRVGKNPKLSTKNYSIPQAVFPFHWKLVIDRHDYYEIALLSLLPKASKFINEQFQTIQSYLDFPAATGQQKKNKFDFISTQINDFQSVKNLEWKLTPKFGNNSKVNGLAMQVWQHDAFSKFRHFASIPILYRIDKAPDSECVWFTDLRYVFPLMKPPFRYGMCRHHQSRVWKLFRLHRGSDNSRQLLRH